jgi:pilus assembly protein Flp/PilA
MRSLSRFFQDENGAALAEYGILIALIAIVCVAAVSLLGHNISQYLFDTAANAFPPTP